MSNATKPVDQKQQSMAKKLVLKRETLAVLDPSKLEQVIGGQNVGCIKWRSF